MVLYIDTTKSSFIEIGILKGKRILIKKREKVGRKQSENLMPLIVKFLHDNKIKINKIKEVRVKNYNGSYTSLRLGVVTANALGYGLGIKVSGLKEGGRGLYLRKRDFTLVAPLYGSSPAIIVKKPALA